MNEPRDRRSIGRWIVTASRFTGLQPAMRMIALALALVLCAGCFRNYGTGGTGEWVVPREELRDISESDFGPYATTRPASTQMLAAATNPSSQPARKEVTITIEQVRQAALANNLDIHVEVLNPTIAQESVSAAEAQFESLFTTNINYASINQPSSSELVGSQVEQWNVTPGVQVPLQTGGSISVNAPMSQLDTNNDFSTLNPSYTANPNVQLQLPLLRGFGIDANAQQIRVAFYQSQQAQARTKLEVIRVLAEAERVYWRLYAARRALEVRRTEYELAVAQLDRARRQVRAGVVADVEVIRAESGVADRVEGIITAQNAIKQQQRDLKRIMNSQDLPLEGDTLIIPATPPKQIEYNLDAQELVDRSMNQRMELLDTELQIAAETANIKAAKNALLPLVSLQYTYTMNGLGDSFDSAWNQVADNNFQNHEAGIQLQIPIGNEAARSQLRAAIARRIQQLATKQQRMAQIAQEVYDAVDTLQASWQRIVAARQRVVLAARTMDAETRQFQEGLRTSTDVLDAQTDLANAQLSEISNLTEYQIAQIDIAFATGTLLGASHVVWSPAPQPKVGRYFDFTPTGAQ